MNLRRKIIHLLNAIAIEDIPFEALMLIRKRMAERTLDKGYAELLKNGWETKDLYPKGELE